MTMFVTIKSAYGTKVEIEFDDEGLSPDGMNTRLREIGDVFERAVQVDGLAPVGVGDIEVSTEIV